MNRLQQLLEELCPNGVEYKKLSDIANIVRGVRVVREQLKSEGEIPVFQNSLKPLGYHDKSNVKANTAFIIGAGAAGEIGYSEIDFWAADDCYYCVCPQELDNRYLYFVLMKNQPLLFSKVRKASIPRLSRTIIEKLDIPVPPIEIQREIVRILDEYSTSVTALQQELEKELTARKKQYEYYRDMLLDFDSFGGVRTDFEWRTLGEICNIIVGGEAPADCSKRASELYKYPIWANGKEVYGYAKTFKVESDAVCISSIGANTGTVFFHCGKFTPIIRLKVLTPKYDNINVKYLFYAVSTVDFAPKKSSVPNMSSNDIKKVIIPIPPVAEQERIVAILDRFDKLCNDITEGLPAEIEARRKQYEYYRDKLLTFKELTI